MDPKPSPESCTLQYEIIATSKYETMSIFNLFVLRLENKDILLVKHTNKVFTYRTFSLSELKPGAFSLLVRFFRQVRI